MLPIFQLGTFFEISVTPAFHRFLQYSNKIDGVHETGGKAFNRLYTTIHGFESLDMFSFWCSNNFVILTFFFTFLRMTGTLSKRTYVGNLFCVRVCVVVLLLRTNRNSKYVKQVFQKNS